MKIEHIKFTKQQFDLIPDAERTLLILLAHAANEFSVLTKLFRYCTEYQVSSDIEEQAKNAQAMVLGRILTAKLYECWQLLGNAFFSTKLSKAYEPKFDIEAVSALTSLKRYFGKENLIKTVRNRHAFHYTPDQIAIGYAKLAEDEVLNIYVSETNANTLYSFADVIAGYSLVEDINPGEPAKAFDALISESSRVVGWLNIVIGTCMSIAIKMYLGETLEELGAETLEIEGVTDWKDISVPYFVAITDEEVT